ncbi:AFG1-like ATPase [Aquimixticola soesokkakensis]|uniref:AFG1-like ATPase n=1 Tax=Aquimixticola soesokkakensis TaxID=1519096 RepID=A0A1Y5RFS3_9RHOB|nr:cell division protein ZapE [Aquimixticola soesokkakensis]SLN16179.1 AFG1-like ATPase [Aquimixticola soesokkakensis]
MVTISEEYEARVANGTLTADPAQAAVLPMFDRLKRELEAAPAQAAKKSLFSRLKKADAPEPVRGLYLWGGVGRGKSMLMDLFADMVDVPKRRIHFHAFMQEVHNGLNAARAKGIQDTLVPVADDIAADVRLLCFDEMQITDITDAMIVGRLFEQLFARGVTVVTTSNRLPDDLYKNGLNRQLFVPFIEVIKQRLDVHELASPQDYRQGRLTGEQVYFSPVNDDARRAVDAIWADLTGGKSEGLTLTVKGRELDLPQFHNGMARVRFWDLCAKALGAADYLALAEAVKLLILEDVPSLGRSNFNEAKRFVTLIDALYEADVRLIVTAADSPEQLYLEGEGTFEFERTASRLREMQDANWGAERD